MSERTTFRAYCDESCHLENDHAKAMSLGGVWLPANEVRPLNRALRELKIQASTPRPAPFSPPTNTITLGAR